MFKPLGSAASYRFTREPDLSGGARASTSESFLDFALKL